MNKDQARNLAQDVSFGITGYVGADSREETGRAFSALNEAWPPC